MFDLLLRKSCKTNWTFGPVKCTWLPLRGIDFVSEHDGWPKEESCALYHIIKENRAELLMVPLIQELLEQKWDRFAKHYFIESFLSAVLQAVLFSIMVVVPHPPGVEHGWISLWSVHWFCRGSVLFLTCRKAITEVACLL